MKYLILFIFFIHIQLNVEAQDWNIKDMDGSYLIFDNGKKINTKLYELKVLDKIKINSKHFLILSGKGCNECDAEKSIYIHSPEDGDMLDENEQTRYTYPGSIYDPFTNETIFSSKFYYGECLSVGEKNWIWIQKSQAETGVVEESIFILEYKEGELVGKFIEQKIEKIKKEIETQTKDCCKFIKGIEQAASM
ncbi:MAG: hypothetical protein JJ971_13455 [Balneolaceae bacterium]|nr:hypothetical protein [Balneolaceae bacterium]MBO6547137.1 hypothetical protein [Balneolaceae bacterium]MBO6647915.1 hypothetical protein [Balneolaceae bacterium]